MQAHSIQRAFSDPTRIISFVKNFSILDRRKLYQTWEHAHLTRLFSYLDVDCVFDIGANQGQYAQMLRKRAGYKGLIFSFEPSPHDARVARERSAGDDKWKVIEVAIADADGEAQFNVMQQSEFSSLSVPRHDEVSLFKEMNSIAETVTVRTELLGTMLKKLRDEYGFSRPFLKMDTQGFDVNIVKASHDVIRSFVGLQSELSIAKLYTASVDFRDALTEYERCGFVLSAFVPNNAGHFPRLLETDCVMIRSDLVVQEAPYKV
ncbi:FkbM family methyltransferase [Caballeronia arvi]|uniref:FkbM family methyltransferase n=1 Tax=Caballeronia arvi TaxID=1777135 RepID=A0A158KMP2_9BURK|nr:FkbM family methyltransferase [Caballeronia arvi]SAL82265.1 FkbM family methyltransferase [Caballeronia arvi]